MTAPLLTSAQVAPQGNRSDGPAGSGPVGRAASRGPSWPWRCGCGPWCQRPPTGLSTQTAETRIANPPRPDDASCSAPRGAQCGEVGTKVPGRLGARGHGSGDHTEAPRHAMSPELGDPPPSDQRADLCSPRMCVDVRAFALGWRPHAPCDGNDGDTCPGRSPAGCVTVTPPTRGGAFRSVLVTVTPPTRGRGLQVRPCSRPWSSLLPAVTVPGTRYQQTRCGAIETTPPAAPPPPRSPLEPRDQARGFAHAVGPSAPRPRQPGGAEWRPSQAGFEQVARVCVLAPPPWLSVSSSNAGLGEPP